MFKIENYTLHLTRGDIAIIELTVDNYIFKPGDKIEFRVYNKRLMDQEPILFKVINVEEETSSVNIELSTKDTSLGAIENRETEYWYEVELNDEQTIIGFDENGAKKLILYPEGVEPNATKYM